MENWNEFGNVVNIETLENKIPDIWKGIRNDIKENVWKWIEKALSQKEDEVRKEVEKLKKFNLPISESGRVPIKYRYWNKGYNQAIEDVLQSLTK